MSARLIYAGVVASAPIEIFTPQFLLISDLNSFRIKNKGERKGSTFVNDSESDASKLRIWIESIGEKEIKSLDFWELIDEVKSEGINMKRLSMIE